jgi:hydrogenase nickel incorporation protein HypA/HybF
MHEYSLISALMRELEQRRLAEGADRLLAIRLEVGEFAGVEPELLRSAFRQLTAGTWLEQTTIELHAVPLSARCDGCGHEFPVRRFQFVCPSCCATAVTVVRGEELMLESIQMESSA